MHPEDPDVLLAAAGHVAAELTETNYEDRPKSNGNLPNNGWWVKIGLKY